MRILLVEDNTDIADFLQSNLLSRGFCIDRAMDAASGLSLLKTNEYDLVLLDLNLPDMPGERVCEATRRLNPIPPVLIITVLASVADKVRLLNAGADDYLVKPFSFEELVARIRALLRRAHGFTPDTLTSKDLVLDAVSNTVMRQGRDIDLTRKEFSLLEYLLRHRGSIVSKATLIEHAWDNTSDPLSAALETHMGNLRRKIGQPALIRTVHTRGYRID